MGRNLGKFPTVLQHWTNDTHRKSCPHFILPGIRAADMYVHTLDMDMFTLIHTRNVCVCLQPGSAGKPGGAAPSVVGHVALREVRPQRC